MALKLCFWEEGLNLDLQKVPLASASAQSAVGTSKTFHGIALYSAALMARQVWGQFPWDWMLVAELVEIQVSLTSVPSMS